MSKDPFQILADELTLIRHDMANLQRTSLNKEEAEALHQIVAKAVKDMRKATADTPQVLQSALKADRDQIIRDASQAATRAAECVLGDIRDQLSQERLKLSQATGEARREAWRWFGGFWVWLVAMLAMGALLGTLGTFWMRGVISASDFRQYTRIFCTSAGGQIIQQEDGSSFCAVWINRSSTADN